MTGAISTVTGQAGISGWTPDGPAATAVLSGPSAITLVGNSTLFWTEQGTCIVRRLDLATGWVSTAAGMPRGCGYADGPALAAKFGASGLLGIVAENNSLFIADTGG